MRTLTLILLIVGNQLFCQPFGKNKFPLQRFTSENSKSATKFFGKDLLQQTFTDHSNRVLAQLYRFNDSSLVYEEFDTLGRILCKGILASQFEETATIEIPDLAADPTGTLGIFKDTVVSSSQYGKKGIWMERETDDIIWNGSYVANEKDGLWTRNREVDHTRFSQVDTIIFYKGGVAVGWQLPSTLDSIFTRVRGNWYKNAVLSSKHYLFIQKDPDNANLESDFNFLQPDSSYQLYVGNSFWPESREYMQLRLSFVNKNNEWLIMADNQVVYQLLNLDDHQIILRRF